jgi:DNA-binding LacI/PurR family transcriptional regulator
MDIQDVAREANVSTATVSRVLNRSPKVKRSTADHVEQVIRDLNYVPNTSARQLRIGRSKLFGLIISDINNPFFPELIAHFEDNARKHGIDVIFSHTNYQQERLEHCLQRMIERNVDAVAILTSENCHGGFEAAAKRRLPFVLMNQDGRDTSFSNIYTNYDIGVREAIDHLYALGHRKIGFISGPRDFDSVRTRHQAFLNIVQERGLHVRTEWIVEGDMHVEGGYAAMKQMLSAEEKPTAVLSSNDIMALGALQAAHEAGVNVPGQMSIIGIDNLPLCEVVTPKLTSVNIPRKEVARVAFAMLFHATNPADAANIETPTIDTHLVQRQSTGAPLAP